MWASAVTRRRLACLSLFWHFQDLIWIGVFTFVYLRELHITPRAARLHD